MNFQVEVLLAARIEDLERLAIWLEISLPNKKHGEKQYKTNLCYRILRHEKRIQNSPKEKK